MSTSILSDESALSEAEKNLLRMLKSNWFFIKHCVLTKDPVDLAAPVKPAPWEKDYIQQVVRLWNSPDGRLFLMAKSRRLWMSWLFIALHLHLAMKNPHSQIFFISKKEEDADELVSRAEFILQHIPEDILPPDLVPPYKKTHCLLDFGEWNGSFIRGIPQGSGQLRQHAASAILWDEAAFHEDAQETYGAMAPTLLAPHASGRLTIVSSVLGGTLFEKIYRDMLDR